MNHIPGTAAKHFWTSKWFVELFSSVPPMIIAALGCWRFYDDPATKLLAYFAGGAALWLVASSGLKVVSTYKQDLKDQSDKDHRDLRAAVHVLHSTVAGICKLDNATSHKKLRATFHRVVPPIDQSEQLEQLVNYVGGDGNGIGRKFSIRSGVTGKSAATLAPYTHHRLGGDDKDCRRELKESWGYTDKDLKSLSLDRFSALAIPVVAKNGTHAVGVIYFDSPDKSLFRDKMRLALIVTACDGLSKYISERYST